MVRVPKVTDLFGLRTPVRQPAPVQHSGPGSTMEGVMRNTHRVPVSLETSSWWTESRALVFADAITPFPCIIMQKQIRNCSQPELHRILQKLQRVGHISSNHVSIADFIGLKSISFKAYGSYNQWFEFCCHVYYEENVRFIAEEKESFHLKWLPTYLFV